MKPGAVACAIAFATLLAGLASAQAPASQPSPSSPVVQPTATFRSNDKQSGIELDLKPGEKDYIRVEIATGLAKGHGRLVSVAADQGTYEIKKLKPLDSNKVKDTQHVSIAEIGN